MDQGAIDRVRVIGAEPSRARRFRRLLWREWCFYRALLGRLWVQLSLLVVLLAVGGAMFRYLEPAADPNRTWALSIFYTWSLMFGQPPEAFPAPLILRVMFFVVPIIGLTVVVESLVEFAGMLRDRQKAETSWCRIMAQSLENHVVLVGVGRLGYRIFLLLRRLGRDVVVIEANPNNQFLEDIRRDGSPLLIGDARREALLADAGIRDAAAIILATSDDLANLEIALDARRFKPDIRVVLRMFDETMADKVREGFNIKLAMSQSSLSAPTFALKALEPSVVSSAVVGDRLVVSMRWTIQPGQEWEGKTIAEMMSARRCAVLERKPTGSSAELFPPPGTRLSAGDVLLIQGTYEDLVGGALPRSSAPTHR